MSNIQGLNTEESEWVMNFLRACSNGENFTERAPSKKAAEHIISIIKNVHLKMVK